MVSVCVSLNHMEFSLHLTNPTHVRFIYRVLCVVNSCHERSADKFDHVSCPASAYWWLASLLAFRGSFLLWKGPCQLQIGNFLCLSTVLVLQLQPQLCAVCWHECRIEGRPRVWRHYRMPIFFHQVLDYY